MTVSPPLPPPHPTLSQGLHPALVTVLRKFSYLHVPNPLATFIRPEIFQGKEFGASLWYLKSIRERVSEEVKHSHLFPSFSPLFPLVCFALLIPSESPVHSTAVKGLSYFVLIAGISFTSKWKNRQRCINQFVDLTIFSFFLKILSFFIFAEHALC